MVNRLSVPLLGFMLFSAMPALAAWSNHDHDGHWNRGSHWNHGYFHSDWHGRYWHHFDRPHFGFRASYIPRGYFTVWYGGSPYYYYDGVYYSGYAGNYVVVPPPVGATVSMLPDGYQPTTLNGETYYVSNGTYYTYNGYGYQVVTPPQTAAAAVPAASPAAPEPPPAAEPAALEPAPAQPSPASVNTDSGEAFVINVPNDKGGYTAVSIKRSAKGFVGPQGEFYAEFPKVSQLKAMYGNGK